MKHCHLNFSGHIVRFLSKNFKQNVHYICVPCKSGSSHKKTYFLTNETATLLQSSYNLKHQYIKQISNISVKSIIIGIENSSIGFLCNSIKSLNIDLLRQYHIGKYIVDLYIPFLNIVVECDELNHILYNQDKESERQKFIEKEIHCNFIRFNPNDESFDLSEIINQILHIYLLKNIQSNNCI